MSIQSKNKVEELLSASSEICNDLKLIKNDFIALVDKAQKMSTVSKDFRELHKNLYDINTEIIDALITANHIHKTGINPMKNGGEDNE